MANPAPQIKDWIRCSSRRALRLTSGWLELEKTLGASRLPHLNARSTKKERRRSMGSPPYNPRHEDPPTASEFTSSHR
ncbi:hypothetical protein EDB86DRAFT_3082731 [Lactarius hatsudake]|nr:hypothetical protein EDB86DRAFT_3082731 [Lactarius hatsudake]